ncbi:hypothetical protein VDG1235_3756 [Verrucomicrobiia bacterium DG1235]|nr:hypothetical protein VDG1235_3756 [Verrucomicrobiae bacterium DG1235]
MKKLNTVLAALAISAIASADWLTDSILGEDFGELAESQFTSRFEAVRIDEDAKNDFAEMEQGLKFYIESSQEEKDEFTIIVLPSTFVMLRAELYLGEEKVTKESIALMGHSPILSSVSLTKPISTRQLGIEPLEAELEKRDPILLELREIKTIWK